MENSIALLECIKKAPTCLLFKRVNSNQTKSYPGNLCEGDTCTTLGHDFVVASHAILSAVF